MMKKGEDQISIYKKKTEGDKISLRLSDRVQRRKTRITPRKQIDYNQKKREVDKKKFVYLSFQDLRLQLPEDMSECVPAREGARIINICGVSALDGVGRECDCADGDD